MLGLLLLVLGLVPLILGVCVWQVARRRGEDGPDDPPPPPTPQTPLPTVPPAPRRRLDRRAQPSLRLLARTPALPATRPSHRR